ncbi:DUF3613 domain-containing protein [Paraburkholderia sp.]|uniref:DUF3613 domain-containing protein n=1 Tax=Paraburkholderia sp. TaxID=1926495 RepID=UPI002F42C76A
MNNKYVIQGVWRYAGLTLLAAATLTGLQPAWAQSEAAQPPVPSSEIGHATQSWRELQRSNGSAAPVQPMLGAEAGRAYQRYMESFDSKIPDFYSSAVNQGGGSGAQLGSSPQY